MNINFEKITNFNPCVIAETACGHDGSLKKLKELIDIAKNSGTKVIKFQIYKLNERANKNSKEERIFKKLLLSENEWLSAVQYAHKKKLFVFADIFGLDSFNLGEKVGVNGYKIHSEDTLNFRFIEKVINSNKIIIIGVGGSHRAEIKSLLDYIKKIKSKKKIILMTGIQTFPTPLAAHSIAEISDLINKYEKNNLKIGFSDHIKGGEEASYILPLMALSSGASVIEKHFTNNRKFKQTDYHSSLNQNEFKKFLTLVEKFKITLRPVQNLNLWEKSYRKMFKKSPVIQTNKLAGDIIKPSEIIYKKK